VQGQKTIVINTDSGPKGQGGLENRVLTGGGVKPRNKHTAGG